MFFHENFANDRNVKRFNKLYISFELSHLSFCHHNLLLHHYENYKKHPLMSTNTENVVFKQIENIENTEIKNNTERFSCVKCSNNFCK